MSGGAIISRRLRDLADFAERADGPVDHRTLRIELEAIAKTLYRDATDTPDGPGGDGAAIHVQRRIEWPDTDASGHYHYHTALRLFDSAEAVLHDRLGTTPEMFGRLARAQIAVGFRGVVRFNDVVDVRLSVDHVGAASVRYRGTIHHGDVLVAEAELSAVHLDGDGRPSQLPSTLRPALKGGGSLAAEFLTKGQARRTPET